MTPGHDSDHDDHGPASESVPRPPPLAVTVTAMVSGSRSKPPGRRLGVTVRRLAGGPRRTAARARAGGLGPSRSPGPGDSDAVPVTVTEVTARASGSVSAASAEGADSSVTVRARAAAFATQCVRVLRLQMRRPGPGAGLTCWRRGTQAGRGNAVCM